MKYFNHHFLKLFSRQSFSSWISILVPLLLNLLKALHFSYRSIKEHIPATSLEPPLPLLPPSSAPHAASAHSMLSMPPFPAWRGAYFYEDLQVITLPMPIPRLYFPCQKCTSLDNDTPLHCTGIRLIHYNERVY